MKLKKEKRKFNYLVLAGMTAIAILTFIFVRWYLKLSAISTLYK